MTEEWLQFAVNCRFGLKHDYDIVEGPMADDTIWDYVENYMAERISKAACILYRESITDYQI